MFGYLLGGIAAFGSWASRIPRLSRIVRLGLGLGQWVTLAGFRASGSIVSSRSQGRRGDVTPCVGGWLAGPEVLRPLTGEPTAFSPFLIANERQVLRKKPPGLEEQESHQEMRF